MAKTIKCCYITCKHNTFDFDKGMLLYTTQFGECTFEGDITLGDGTCDECGNECGLDCPAYERKY